MKEIVCAGGCSKVVAKLQRNAGNKLMKGSVMVCPTCMARFKLLEAANIGKNKKDDFTNAFSGLFNSDFFNK